MMTPEEMAAIHASAFAGQGRAWAAHEFASLLAQDLVFAVSEPQAFALGRVIAGEAELLTLATHPDYHRQGLARACLAGYEAEAQARGAEISFLEVASDNAAALGLYLSVGYVQTAVRAGYYRLAGMAPVDAVIMRKTVGCEGEQT
jgi:ribosomal-protein-alanine N-acetyltransferase